MGKKLLIVNTYANLWSTGRIAAEIGEIAVKHGSSAILHTQANRILAHVRRLELIKALYRILYIPICFPVFSI